MTRGASSTTTIHLTISPVDDATTVSGDTQASIAEDTSASGDLNATDADGLTDGSYFSISTVPANGSASIDPANGNWTYSPNPDFFGSDSFGVSVTDDQAHPQPPQSISPFPQSMMPPAYPETPRHPLPRTLPHPVTSTPPTADGLTDGSLLDLLGYHPYPSVDKRIQPNFFIDPVSGPMTNGPTPPRTSPFCRR